MSELSNGVLLDDILAKLVNDIATPDDIASLERLLHENPAAQSRYIHYLDLHSELIKRATSGSPEQGGSIATPAVFPDPPEKKRRPSGLLLLAAIAALFLVAAGIGIGRAFVDDRGQEVVAPTASVSEPTDDGVAILVHAVDVDWAVEQPPLIGSVISPGRLKMNAGLAQLEFYSGARLILQGKVDLDVRSADSVTCRSGRLRAFVPEPARGFSVLTPKFEVVDLGTEFGLVVAADSESTVQVFDGEVDVFSADGKRDPGAKRKLFGGDGLSWRDSGEPSQIETEAAEFVTFEDVRSQSLSQLRTRFAEWTRWNETLKEDPRIVARYDFLTENLDQLTDSGPSGAHGSIVGCQPSEGRWPEKNALQFSRVVDRVRVNVPGEFENLTLMAWVRIDTQPERRQSLLLTDRHEIGHIHWQIGSQGELRLGARPKKTKVGIARGYASSPPVFTSKRLGVWSFVCSIYDGSNGEVRHFVDGVMVSQNAIVREQTVQIGRGDIGNWSVPRKPRRKANPVRNFVGRMDELTVWNEALTASDIAEIYSQSKP